MSRRISKKQQRVEKPNESKPNTKKSRLSKNQQAKAKQAAYRREWNAKNRDKVVKQKKEYGDGKATKPIKRRAPKGTGLQGRSGMYWTEEIDQIIEQFNKTENAEQREAIFNEKLKYPFGKLVENIFNTFKFSYFETGPLDVQKETVAHLVANIRKFEPDKGKSFSYFSIVAKNYLIALNNANYRRFNQHISIDQVAEAHQGDNSHVPRQLTDEDEERKDFQHKEFFKKMVAWWDNNVDRVFPKEKERVIAQAVIELFRHCDRLEQFSKKPLYLMVREIANCDKTSHITKIINKMVKHYETLRREYIETGDINCEQPGRFEKDLLPLISVRNNEEQAFSE